MKYLGIDYGKRKIGLALSEGVYASAWKVLSIGGLKDAIEKTRVIIKKEEISEVIVGTAESGESRKIALNFIKSLKLVLPDLPIVGKDETLSTQKAVNQMIEMNVSKKARKQEDAFAAALILQEYLDSK